MSAGPERIAGNSARRGNAPRRSARAPRRRLAAAGALLAILAAGCGPTVAPPPPPPQAEPEPDPVAEAPPPPPEVVAPLPPPPPPPPPPPDLFDRFSGFAAAGGVRAALLVPLSGPGAEAGRALERAAELALFDRGDPAFVLMPKDTRGVPAGAEEAMREALADGADIVLGPLFGESARRAAPIARAAGVPVLAFTNDRRAAASGAYAMGFTPGAQVARAVAWARGQGSVRFAVLAPAGAYGDAVTRALDSAARGGAVVTAAARYDPAAGVSGGAAPALDALVAARRDPARGFDALLIAAAGESLRILGPELAGRGIHPSEALFLGTAQWKDRALLGEPTLHGAVFAAPEDGPAFRAFSERYRAAFGAEPTRLAALGYDAAALASALAGRPDIETALADPSGFAGAGGVFRFAPDRVAERALALYRLAREEFELIEPAPADFAVPAF